MDELTLRKLSLLKVFFKHGVQHSQIDSKLDNMLSIHHFDLCNEFLLRILADEIKVDVDKLATLEHIYNCIQKNYKNQKKIGLKYQKEIMRVRKLRNDIQHNAETKTHDDVKICFVHTKDFIETTLKDIFGVEFEKISLISLIEEKILREKMFNTGDLIKEKKFPDALNLINYCFEKRLERLKSEGYIPSTHSLLGFSTSFSQQFDIRPDDIRLYSLSSRNPDIEQLKEAIKKNYESIKRIAEKVLELVDKKFENYTQGLMYEIAILGSGINYTDYSRYKNIILHYNIHQKLNEADTLFCFDFVVEILIKNLSSMNPTSDVRFKLKKLSEFL